MASGQIPPDKLSFANLGLFFGPEYLGKEREYSGPHPVRISMLTSSSFVLGRLVGSAGIQAQILFNQLFILSW